MRSRAIAVHSIRRRRWWAAGACWIGLLLLGCEQQQADLDDAPIRLVEVLGEANVVESPLLLETTTGEPQRRSVFTSSFDAFPEGRWQWPEHATIAASSRGDPAVHVTGKSSRPYVFVLPAAPSTIYRVARSIEPWTPGLDLVVSETTIALTQEEVTNHPKDYARAVESATRWKLLQTHHFAAPALGRWQSDEIEILTTPQTRSLILTFTRAAREIDAWLDDVSVEELALDDGQRARWLADLHTHPGSDPRLGIAKHGQLLPLLSPRGRLSGGQDENYSFRSALYAPTPTRLRFELDVPRSAVLSFATGLARGTREGDEATYRVVVETDEGAEVVFSTRLHADVNAKNVRWRDHEVSLAAFEGKRVVLELITEAPAERQGLALWGNPIVVVPRASGARPNVLVIAVDTLRADRLGVYGHRPELSRNIASLAADGVKLERAYSSTNWTTPAFTTFFTGLMPSRHGVTGFGRELSPARQTLAEAFSAGGWITNATLYKPFLYDVGLEQGFDRWFNQPFGQARAESSADKVLDWLAQNGQRRFFLFWHLNDPHQPFDVPDEYLAATGAASLVKEFGFRMPASIDTGRGCRSCVGERAESEACKLCRGRRLLPRYKRMTRELYDAAIHYVDDQIGRVVQALVDRDLYDETLILFLADHGEMLWDRKELFGHGGPLMYQELVRIPVVIKPHRTAGIPTGWVLEEPVRLMDIPPTLLDLAGAEFEAERMEGRSFAVRLDPSTPPAPRAAVIENVRERVLAVKERRWSLHMRLRAADLTTEKLFDLVSDPTERKDVYAAHPNEVERLRRLAFSHLLRNRPGTYLLLKAEAGPARVEAPLDGEMPIFHWGLAHEEGGFEGEARGGLSLFAQLPARLPEGAPVEARSGDALLPTRLHRLAAGELEEGWISRLAMGAHVVRVEDPVGVTEKRSISDEQRRELEALGYIE